MTPLPLVEGYRAGAVDVAPAPIGVRRMLQLALRTWPFTRPMSGTSWRCWRWAAASC